MSQNTTIGVLSDTHGTLPHFVVQEFRARNVNHILHAGDVCDAQIITSLQRIAPTTWVRGNMDSRKDGSANEIAEIDGLYFYILHNAYEIDIDPKAADVCAVIHGHLHLPSIEWKNEVLFLNPGSCAYPRGGHPPSIAIINISDDTLHPEIIYKK